MCCLFKVNLNLYVFSINAKSLLVTIDLFKTCFKAGGFSVSKGVTPYENVQKKASASRWLGTHFRG